MTAERRRPPKSPASSPLRPVAIGPCELIFATSCGLMWPVRTIRTTLIASVLVTRYPPLNSLGIARRSSMFDICGPPPCTTTGFTPT